MSRPRKQRILGIYIYFNLALGSFGKEGNVLVRISMSPIIIISSSFADILQKNFLKFFSFVFLLIFPLFAVSSNKTNLLRIYLEYLGKKKTNKQTNKRTNKAKQKAANSVYFSSITLRITPQFSVYLCLLFFFFSFNTEQGGQELELSESLKRRNFLSGSQ